MVQINRCLMQASSVFLCCSFFLFLLSGLLFFLCYFKSGLFPSYSLVILYSLYFQSYWKSMAIQPFLNISIVTWNSRHHKHIKARAHLLLEQRRHETGGLGAWLIKICYYYICMCLHTVHVCAWGGQKGMGSPVVEYYFSYAKTCYIYLCCIWLMM